MKFTFHHIYFNTILNKVTFEVNKIDNMAKIIYTFYIIFHIIFIPSLSIALDDPWIGIYKYGHPSKSLGGYDVKNYYTVTIFKHKRGYDVSIHTPSLGFLELACMLSNTKKNLICFPLHRHIQGGFNIFKEEVMYIGKNKYNQIGFKFSDEFKEKLRKYSSDLSNINNKDFLFTKVE